MFRTTFHFRRWGRFVRTHGRLLVLLGLLLFGFVMGCVLFSAYGHNESAFLSMLFTVKQPEPGFKGVLTTLYNSCFQAVVLLLVLFVSGLSACGLPLILAVPLFFGLGFGTCAAYYYNTGWVGVWQVVRLIPSIAIKSAAILMGAAEATRMTLLFSGQLLAGHTVSEGLNKEFRLYILRFLIFLLIAVAGGIVDVLLG